MRRTLLTRAALAGAVMFLVPLASADVLSVPDEYATIQAAIDAAETGDEVVLQPGTYDETFDYGGKGITVRSAQGPLTTRISRTSSSGVTVTASSTPAGAVLEGIYLFGFDRQLEVQGGVLAVRNCRFVSSGSRSLDVSGGAEVEMDSCQFVSGAAGGLVTGSTLSMVDCSFRFGTSCLELRDGTSADLLRVIFAENDSAGALVVSTSTLVVEDCQFLQNHRSQGGGGLDADNSQVTCTDTVFEGNGAGGPGGAVRLVDTNFTAQGLVFDGNSGTTRGGAIDVDGGQLLLSNSTFSGNVANSISGAYGGDLALIGCHLEITDCTSSEARSSGSRDEWASYTVTSRGGSLYVDTGCSGVVAGFVAQNPQAYCYARNYGACSNANREAFGSAYGGGMYLEDPSAIQFVDCRLEGARATCVGVAGGCYPNAGLVNTNAYGGGIYVVSGTLDCEGLALVDCSVSQSASGTTFGERIARCGGIHHTGAGGLVSIVGGELRQCTAPVDGGGIYAVGVRCELVGVRFEGCTTSGTGGAVHTDGGGLAGLILDGCSVIACAGSDGAIRLENTEGIILRNAFSGNSDRSITFVDGLYFPMLGSNVFCGSESSEILGPWIDKGGNVFDADCTADCDDDGLSDDYEIQTGLDADCNENGLPDSCESGGDCDDDGILDSCAIADGSLDCNLNGLPDECEADCDGDGLLDVCAIQAGAEDCNRDGVPDACQLASGEVADANNDGILDPCQSLDFTGLATEIVLIEDRILDSTVPATAVCYRLYATFDDIQGTLSGVFGDAEHPMSIAAPQGFWQDGLGGDTTAAVPCDERGSFPDLRYDSWLTIGAVCASDNMVLEEGIDFTDFNAGGVLAADDGIVFITPDEPQGVAGESGRVLLGQFTSIDGALPTGTVNLLGQNADGTDWIAYDIGWPEPSLVDCNGNGIHDAYDLSTGTSRDCDGSGLPDECEYEEFVDCNNNGIPDLCDVADGTSGDADGDFVPDECECLGDTNRDGLVNVYDIIEVILHWGETGELDADVSGDGVVDGFDLSLVLQGYGTCL